MAEPDPLTGLKPARCQWASCHALAATVQDGWPMCGEHAHEAKLMARAEARHADAFDAPRGRPVKPCGTEAAFARHRRKGEQPCDPCVDAHARYEKQRRNRNR